MQEVLFILPLVPCHTVQDNVSSPLWVSVGKKVGMQEVLLSPLHTEEKVGMQEVLSSLLRTKEKKVLVVDEQQNPLRASSSTKHKRC